MAVLQQIANEWQRKDSMQASGTDVGAGSIVWSGEFKLLEEVKRKISVYKRVRL